MSRDRAICALLLFCVAFHLNFFLLGDVPVMFMQFCVSLKHDFFLRYFIYFLMGAVEVDNRMVFHCSQKVLVKLLKK